MNYFRTKFSEDIFNHKYRHEDCETWPALADTLVEDVCRDKLSKSEKQELKKLITEMKFIPGGRYLYYAGRQFKAFNNCFLLKCEEDSREDWANLSWKAESCLMTGGGIGSDYSIYRPKNSIINRTGGLASGPISKMKMINEIGREVMQGGSRRSAIYASLNWKHQDITEFIHAKDWSSMNVAGTDMTVGDLKQYDFNFPAPMDMTNISVNYDTEWLETYKKTGNVGSVFLDNVKQALKTSEPGFSFNFYEKEGETLRNACQPAEATVLTPTGISTIGTVQVGDKIWGGSDWTMVTAKWSTGIKPVYSWETEHCLFLGTRNHRVLQYGVKTEVKDCTHIDWNHEVSFGTNRILEELYIGKEEVFDITVDNSTHTYWTGGCLVSNCTEVTSEDDSDVCNLGSINLAVIETLEELKDIVDLATKFLLCGTLVADLPYAKVYTIREKNRRLGLGLMGIHEWLLKRNYTYEVVPELHEWLAVYKNQSNYTSRRFADKLSISRPVANRAIAPTGSIGILAGTTTGVEPVFATAYKRRYLKGRTQWVYQYVIDGTAKILIDKLGINPEKIESAIDLAANHEKRIKFQADVQDYVDMSISSTINLPAWGTELNNESTIVPFAKTLAKYSHRLRGFTCYADGSRGGQPITPVSYQEAKEMEGQEFEEVFSDICELSGKGGHCGV